MAFIENTGGQGGRFLKILDGSIVEKVADNTPNSEVYEFEYPRGHAKAGQKGSYSIRRYAAVEGDFVRLERKELAEHQIFGYNLVLSDEDGEFAVFFKDRSRTTDRFLKVFENLDLSKPIRIDVWKDKDSRNAITFKQDGQNVSQKWDRNTFPAEAQPEEVMGKWDYSAQDKFLYKHFRDNVLPNLPGTEKAKAAGAAGGDSTSDDDEVPF